MLLLYILGDDWSIFIISRSNEQLQQELEYTLLNATETYRMLQIAFRPSCMNRASVFEWHKRFKEGRESVRMMRSVEGVRKTIHQSWFAKGLGLGLGLLSWGFKGVQEEIPSEEASTLQIGSVAFLPVQCTSTQLHPYHRVFDQDVYQDISSASLAHCDFWLFPKFKEKRRGCRYETIGEMKEAVTKVIVMLTQEDFHGAFQKLLEQYNKSIAAGGYYFEGD